MYLRFHQDNACTVCGIYKSIFRLNGIALSLRAMIIYLIFNLIVKDILSEISCTRCCFIFSVRIFININLKVIVWPSRLSEGIGCIIRFNQKIKVCLFGILLPKDLHSCEKPLLHGSVAGCIGRLFFEISPLHGAPRFIVGCLSVQRDIPHGLINVIASKGVLSNRLGFRPGYRLGADHADTYRHYIVLCNIVPCVSGIFRRAGFQSIVVILHKKIEKEGFVRHPKAAFCPEKRIDSSRINRRVSYLHPAGGCVGDGFHDRSCCIFVCSVFIQNYKKRISLPIGPL